jgi:hypothetical protein
LATCSNVTPSSGPADSFEFKREVKVHDEHHAGRDQRDDQGAVADAAHVPVLGRSPCVVARARHGNYRNRYRSGLSVLRPANRLHIGGPRTPRGWSSHLSSSSEIRPALSAADPRPDRSGFEGTMPSCRPSTAFRGVDFGPVSVDPRSRVRGPLSGPDCSPAAGRERQAVRPCTERTRVSPEFWSSPAPVDTG